MGMVLSLLILAVAKVPRKQEHARDISHEKRAYTVDQAGRLCRSRRDRD